MSNPVTLQRSALTSSNRSAVVKNAGLSASVLLYRLGVVGSYNSQGILTLLAPRGAAYRCAIYGSGTLHNPTADWFFCHSRVLVETFYRLLEDGGIRLTEDGSFRILENG